MQEVRDVANPIRRLKEILGELQRNGRQSLDLLRHLTERMATIEGRLESLETTVRPVPQPAHPAEESRTYFGLNELDRRLERYVDHDAGYFVELGANDGIAQSNTLYFEKFRGWHGLLVEPVLHNFLNCLKVRSPTTSIFCCACTSFEYRERFVEIAFSNLMSTPIGLESDIADHLAHAEAGRQFLMPSDRVVTFGARARPLNDLLIEAGAPEVIDLLSLDVEGAEIEVLKGIDHGRFRFRYMCIECRDIGKMQAYLRELGYVMVEQLSGHDCLFRHEGLDGSRRVA
jgi:FkbM family methyltransferase